MTAAEFIAIGFLAGWFWEERRTVLAWIDAVLDLLAGPPTNHPFPVVQALGLFAASDPDKDRVRIAKNEEALALARAGDAFALSYLLQRTGDHGTQEVPGYGVVGGWGSKVARDDARAKYDAADELFPEVDG
jgi:hypothetical protein